MENRYTMTPKGAAQMALDDVKSHNYKPSDLYARGYTKGRLVEALAILECLIQYVPDPNDDGTMIATQRIIDAMPGEANA